MRHALLIALASLAPLVVVAGCTQKAPLSSGTTPKFGGGVPSDLPVVTKASKEYRIALIMKAASNPFFATMQKGGEKAASELGIKLLAQTITDESSDQQQMDKVDSMVSQKVDAILIAPANSTSLVKPLMGAQKAGIPVINVDNRLDPDTVRAEGLELVAYVGADNEEGGWLAGEHLCKLLGETGKVAMLEGRRGVDNAEARKRGFLKACEAHPDIEVVASDSADWATDKAQDKFAAMLSAHPEIQGLFCANDNMAVGAIAAIKEKNKTGSIVVVGYDNIKAAQDALKEDTLAGTIEQHPDLMGYEAVKAAVAHLEGKPVKTEVMVPLEVITKDKL